MKRISVLLIVCFVLSVLTFGGQMVWGETTKTSTEKVLLSPKSDVKLLIIGNSFSICLKAYLPSVVESVPGCHLKLGDLTIGGCTLERHWNNITREEVDPSFKYFKKYTYKEIMCSEKWDYVSIQQASGFSWQPDSYYPFIQDLYQYVKKNVPTAEILLQQTWSYRPDEPRLKQWGFDQKVMYEKLEAAYNKAARDLNIRVIPMGFAVQMARSNQPGGYNAYNPTDYIYPKLPDVNRFFTGTFKWTPDKKTITGDAYHLNDRGKYLQACVWFAFLYQRKTSEIKFKPDTISVEDADYIRGIAQKAVDEFIQVKN